MAVGEQDQPPTIVKVSPVARFRAAWRCAMALIGVLFFTIIIVFGAAAPAAAEDELIIESDAEFVVDVAAMELDVEVLFNLTNDKPPTVTETSTEDFFFENFAFLVLGAATDITVTVDGQIAGTTREGIVGNQQFDLISVELPERLGYEESVDATVRYRIPNGDARSRDPVRVSSSYLAFPVYACCDSGRAALRVILPDSFGLDLVGEDPGFVQSVANGEITLAVRDLAAPQAVNVFIFGRNDAELVLTDIDIAGNAVQIQSWPDDPQWAEFVESSVTGTLPVLEDLIGEPWPLDRALRVVQTATPYLFGYAGWYNHQGAVIEIGEDLNDQALAHEISHVWFSDDLFDSHWINEGLAEFYAQAAVQARGQLAGAPVVDPPNGLFSQPLNQWVRPIGEPTAADTERERYGYGASWFVMDSISNQIGISGLADVLTAARRGEISYAAGDAIESDPDAWRSWQRFLDLVEERGGWAGVEPLFRERVVAADEVALLDQRAAARQRYAAFATESGDWNPPLGVRSSMTTWMFTDAVAQMDAAALVLAENRDDIAAQAAALGLPVISSVQTAYEASQSLDDLALTQDVADRQKVSLETIASVTELVDAPRDWRTRLGLRGKNPEAQLAEVRAAYEADDSTTLDSAAAELTQVMTDAADAGEWVAILVGLIVLGVLAVLLTLFGYRLRRRPAIDITDGQNRESTPPMARQR